MKLTYEDKLEIYKLRKQGVSWPQLGQTSSIVCFDDSNQVVVFTKFDEFLNFC